MSAFFDQDR
jgi:hypothetical protein